MKHPFDIPESKKIRLIINTDAKNEADDPFAIVHALLTPRFKIKGIIGAHFGTYRTDTSMQESYDEVVKILDIMKLTDEVPVYKGAIHALPDEETPVSSEGADFIIEEAMKDDPTPLYVAFLGPITDLAAAYMKEPAIAEKLTALWIGGGSWPDGEFEFNLMNDINAANVAFKSTIPLWVIPQNAYKLMRVSLAELAVNVKPYGEIGAYLFQQLIDFNFDMVEKYIPAVIERAKKAGHEIDPESLSDWPKGEMWHLGDSPIVSLLLDDHQYGYEMKPAPRITEDMRYVHYQNKRMIRVYHYVDSTFTLQDMYAKLKLHYVS
ncbi:Inosine-uridine preferring nucleoside hydrolase [Evansella caseinilytica]|uniref:Inosine-uridine preferring nucleoside hydrolase n=1 Tax=Evansella caseinilytica TaxID=1503961 RepID=A0A1H3U4W5_9BACI|nr:nucleoside hydrolase [Evansella caseinilytica]SDZ57513.1 Inosine-uridine preferring nucleoside hydrolase [Evansella caseinilytica]